MECTCHIQDLMTRGCRCGAMAEERKRKADENDDLQEQSENASRSEAEFVG